MRWSAAPLRCCCLHSFATKIMIRKSRIEEREKIYEYEVRDCALLLLTRKVRYRLRERCIGDWLIYCLFCMHIRISQLGLGDGPSLRIYWWNGVMLKFFRVGHASALWSFSTILVCWYLTLIQTLYRRHCKRTASFIFFDCDRYMLRVRKFTKHYYTLYVVYPTATLQTVTAMSSEVNELWSLIRSHIHSNCHSIFFSCLIQGSERKCELSANWAELRCSILERLKFRCRTYISMRLCDHA